MCTGCRALLQQPENRCQRCDKALTSAATQCGECLRDPPPFERTFSATQYTSPIDRWVLSLKFGEHLAMARVMAECLRPAVLRLAPEVPLIPVPLHRSRLRRRGHDQARELARCLHQVQGNPVLDDVLERRRATAMQAALKAAQRKKNVRGAFHLMRPVNARCVALVDDVMTTSQTLRACALALKKGGVHEVLALVFARSLP